MEPKEILLKYHGSDTSKKISKDGSLIIVFKVTLQDEHHNYKLTIKSANPALLTAYPEGCEIPVQLNKTSQTKLEA